MDTTVNREEDKHIFGHTQLYKSETAELNLHKHVECEKNPGHKDFIPADRFTLSDLPEIYREEKIFDFIKVVSDLTVRIGLTKISNGRPDYFPDTDNPYMCSEDRGKNVQCSGTGKITQVFELENSKVCQCKDCIKKDQPKNVCGEIWIDTAAHVVFDKLEAENTTCRLFFDKEICAKVIIQGVDVNDVNVRRDYCTLICETCDENLMKGLKEKLKTFEALQRVIYKTVEKPLPSEKMFVIISHPHGTSKHITIGQTSVKIEHENIFSKQFYNTPTCFGSSGAPVLVFGYIGWYDEIVHSGTQWTLNSNDDVYNYSTLGFDYLFQLSLSEVKQKFYETIVAESMGNSASGELCRIPFDNDQSKKENTLSDRLSEGSVKLKSYVSRGSNSKKEDVDGTEGTEKVSTERSFLNLPLVENENEPTILTNMTVTGNDDASEPLKARYVLHRDPINCEKSSDHKEYIPLSKFKLAHLPERYQGGKIYEIIHLLADLTVQMTLTFECPRLQKQLGTGFIYDIIKYTDGFKWCQCDECQALGVARRTWFEIIVFTAAHVVVSRHNSSFNFAEPTNIRAQLFFDHEDSLPFILEKNVKTSKLLNDEDVCILKFTTCNANLAAKLVKTIEQVKHLKSQVYREYHNKAEVGNMFIIVSHPHGCYKQISIGEGKDVLPVGKFTEKLTYTTATCRGSSGAYVYHVKNKQYNLHSAYMREHKINVSNVCFSN